MQLLTIMMIAFICSGSNLNMQAGNKGGSADNTLILNYNAIACSCAQWSDLSQPDTVRTYYYLEPTNDSLLLADELWKGDNLPLQIRVTGRIITYSGYPGGYRAVKGRGDPAAVFRYLKIELLPGSN